MCNIRIAKEPPRAVVGLQTNDELITSNMNESSLMKTGQNDPLNKNRSVRFSSSATVYHLLDLPVASAMTDKEIDDRWYSPTEQRSFINSAKKVCTEFLEGKYLKRTTTSFSGLQKELPSEQEDNNTDGETMRGLDHQVSLLRKKKKETAINVILECQRRLRFRAATPTKKAIIDKNTYLALVSAKVTRFAREVALRTALNDFIAAYPERQFVTGSLMGQNLVSSEQVIRKRKAVMKSITGHQGRRVRMRVMVQETKHETISSQATVLIVP